MELLGLGGLLFWAGVLMFWAGLGLVWTRVKRHGGLDRTRTLHVVFDDDSPMKRPEHRRDRWLFRLGAFLAVFGMMTIYTSTSVGDERDRRVCVETCRRLGHATGRFAPSGLQRRPDGTPERGCYCVGPAGSVELPQPPRPSGG